MQKLERRDTYTPTNAPLVRSNCDLSLKREEPLSVANLKTFSNNPEVDNSNIQEALSAYVYVISKNKKPLMPCTKAKARKLLKKGKVVKRFPFTIQLLYSAGSTKQKISLGVDSGYTHIGLSAITKEKELYAAEMILTTNFYIALSSAQKFAIFFIGPAVELGSNYETSPYIDDYMEQLATEEGFDNCSAYYNEDNWEGVLADFDDLEDEDSFVFISLFGHGSSYWGQPPERSKVEVSPTEDMRSVDLAEALANFESKNIMVLADACMSEGFVNDLADEGVYVIATAEIDEYAYRNATDYGYLEEGPPHEPYFTGFYAVFTWYFFESIHLGGGDSSAYTYARASAIDFYWEYIAPKYMEPHALRSDQCPYTWFETW